ncbi:hypothetical protein SAMN05216505_10466 [Streptomyces prasinopilosus]|uniref:Uncharacterized protein n=1 Tax=Streptomyces prasinopilosus TaxID=67344 RepID=A0A1G6QBS5_9ACTN|nr:hypothetical protein SAMN05216505_10466 [Streptomyces prasinopilosus]
MHFELHRIRARDLVREADAHRLARQARSAPPEPGAAPGTGARAMRRPVKADSPGNIRLGPGPEPGPEPQSAPGPEAQSEPGSEAQSRSRPESHGGVR